MTQFEEVEDEAEAMNDLNKDKNKRLSLTLIMTMNKKEEGSPIVVRENVVAINKGSYYNLKCGIEKDEKKNKT